MDAEERRMHIVRMLSEEQNPVSAASLARSMQVSRQVIVGDIALLRAGGHDIIATARGYMAAARQQPPAGRYMGKIACRHNAADTEKELLAIVGLGGEALDVIVTHPLYGDMTGQLNLASRRDVEEFAAKIKNGQGKLLSELTDGVHLHTVACRDKAAFTAIVEELGRLNFLYRTE
ncbi:MAG: transcription repressor NadR [Clostridiales Family XIII bacterium]|jgi:transcriptional regulator of NAD metabolism|nr:transcription repressor NadR [Clostridiales Family XIII bacterium]